MEKINWLDYENLTKPIFEAYKSVCKNLLKTANISNIKVIGFLSISTDKEKSSNVTGLAGVIAQAGYRVLLVDCKGEVFSKQELFSFSNQENEEAVVTENELRQKIQQCVGQEGLDILAIGMFIEKKEAFFVSETMKHFLISVREEYDYILVDLPDVSTGIDVIEMSTEADGVVLTIAIGRDKLNAVNEVKNKLADVGTTVLGCVLNKR